MDQSSPVLVVDGDAGSCAALSRALRRAGYLTQQAGTGEEALDAARRQLPAGQGRGADLTSREWEVLDFLRAGLSTRQIADRLFISEVTVRRHIGSVLKKLQVSTRADALRMLESA